MSSWQIEINSALEAFITVADLSGDPVKPHDLIVEFLPAPHKQPANLSAGKMAIYAFWWNNEWLKIGKAGPNSGPRYTSQHYTGSAMSTLRGSLMNDARMNQVNGFNKLNPGQWIKQSTCRVNILMSSQRRMELLSLLEAFLHARLRPYYEG